MEPTKSRILYIKRFLENQTDENHPAAMPDILVYLQSEGIPANRKSVARDIDLLIEAGVDVVCNHGHRYSYFIGERYFEIPELKLLVDAVQASKFISSKKSVVLIEKLTTLASTHQSVELSRQIHVEKHLKSENERTYITVDMLHAAIHQGKQISFCYYDYDRNKTRTYKHRRYRYAFSPYALLWDSDRYYAVGYSEKHGRVVTFRVDRIASPKVTDKPAVSAPKDYDITLYTKSAFQMYDGTEPQIVVLRCESSLMNSVIDRFGKDVDAKTVGNEHFLATVSVSVSPTFFGWVFSFGGRMEITAPEDVVSAYLTLARHVLEQNDG